MLEFKETNLGIGAGLYNIGNTCFMVCLDDGGNDVVVMMTWG